MILNSRNTNYIISFPKNFLYPKVQERYASLLKRLPLPYDSVTDYMNASIQSLTFPGVSVENVEQTLHEDKVQWKGGFRMGKQFDKNFDITFKSYEAYINYWMMFDQFEEFLSYDNENEFLPNLTLSFLDQDGFELVTITYKQITMMSISELELNFSSNSAEFQSFTCGFHYNYFEVKRRLD
jgi:hypothetical protein